MGYLVLPIAEFLEATFEIIPPIGDAVNLALMIVGSIATVIWIGMMAKYEKTEVPNR